MHMGRKYVSVRVPILTIQALVILIRVHLGALQRHEVQIHVSETKTKMGGETRYLSGQCCYPSGCHTK